MARWHNGGGGVLSSSRLGGRGACGRRQPTIMDSPSFHSLSFLVDVFVFVFVFVFVSVLNFVLFFTTTASILDSPSFHSLSFLVDIFVCLIVFVFVFVLNFVCFFTMTASILDSHPSSWSTSSSLCLCLILSGFADDNRPSRIFTQLPRPSLHFLFVIAKDCLLTG